MSVCKYILFFFNFLFSVAGIALIALGLVVKFKVPTFSNVVPESVGSMSIWIIVVGAVVFFVSFCGCCGAVKEWKSLLFVYAVCLLVLAAGKIFIAVMLFTKLPGIKEEMSTMIIESFDLKHLTVFQAIEANVHCCGTHGSSSYTDLFHNDTIPASCCEKPVNNVCTKHYSYNGCLYVLNAYVTTYGKNTAYVCCAVVVFELLAFIMTAYVIYQSSNKERRYSY